MSKHCFTTDEELDIETNNYVYGYCNHTRAHSSNVYLMPYEKRYSK